ncbi:hypothetical protein CC86DRAFT_407569 [Ophiobolus disseminans]|uniref:Uncharacterized protein n=1 Tax=Ophiobolus disseminans TaxID=1469910 RepID=A0A6A6ZXC9_9PLEO|nr:hypothetical protein CC86DRAFT_407569 [Ophiobolus disseminans]
MEEGLVHIDLATELFSESTKPDYQAPIDSLFATKILSMLLPSFRTNLWSFADVSIESLVSLELSGEIKSWNARWPWNDPKNYIRHLKNRTDVGEGLQARGQFVEAYSVWEDTWMDAAPVMNNKPPTLVESEFDELMGPVYINIALCYLHYLETVPADFQPSFQKEFGNRAIWVVQVAKLPRETNLRFQSYFILARVTRILGIRFETFAANNSIKDAATFLRCGEYLDPSNDDIRDEISLWIEWGAPILNRDMRQYFRKEQQ